MREIKNKKPLLRILVGPSGSGKSTSATKLIKETGNTWVRVNRDDIRRNILGKLSEDYYSSSKFASTEKHINVLQDEQIRYWLQQGKNVIVDNTNLKVSYIYHFLQEFSHLATIDYSIHNISLEECKRRVLEREGNISVDYIDDQYKSFLYIISLLENIFKDTSKTSFYKSKSDNPKCIIVDIDGTVADCTDVRDPYDGTKLHLDNVIEPVKLLLKRFQGNWFQRLINPIEIIYLSGREQKWEAATIKWLKANGLPFHGKIYMRETGDMRKDSIVKEELYTYHIERYYNTQFVIDDRLQVCHNWYKMGLFVLNVNQGLKHF